MDMIPVKEYAERLGRNLEVVRQKKLRELEAGTTSMKKIGRQWFINPDEPYDDGRVTSGNYVNWRKNDSK